MKNKVKILLVLKKQSNIRHYQSLFTSIGAEVVSGANSFDAIRLFNQHFSEGRPFDLIMTEYILPGRLTGIGLAKIFTTIHPDLRVVLFPAAELYDSEVRLEYAEIRENVIEPDLSNNGLRRLVRILGG